jgi:hypothetical protein
MLEILIENVGIYRMNIKWLGLISVAGLLTAIHTQAEKIKVTTEAQKLVMAMGVDAKPDAAGMVITREVELPPFEKGAFYRPHSQSIARGNRVESIAFNSLAELQNYTPSKTRKGHVDVKDGQFILLQISEGRYLALLPMVSPDVYGQFYIENNQLILKTGNFGTDPVKGDIPLLIWAYGESPYAATRSVWEQVIDSGFVATDWRSNKDFPEMYGYLGWCSWEFYKKTINEQILVDAVHTLENTAAPLRWVIVDDGYFNLAKNRLNTLVPLEKKFPNGWKPVTDLKSPDKIKWMGIWRHSGGAMGGINSNHSMKELEPYLIKTKGPGLLPNGTKEAAAAFYEMNMRDAKENGFDFTKVDFQMKTFELYRGTENPVRSMRANNEALEEAAKKFDIPLLNCIAQPNVNSLQTKYSALTRSSPDYNQADKDKNKCNTYQSFANHLWMGQTVWGDLDMFHSHDERDVKPMAIARAISGGPVYISDEPSKINPDVLIPFAYEDGKILRTAAPATLLPESFFIHPFRDENVFRVIAPMEDGVAAIALFNFTESGKTLSSGFSSKDYGHAGELLQPSEVWEQSEEWLLVYDQKQQTVFPMVGTFSADVGDFDAKLFLLYPKTKGWAVIGRTDKYLPAAAVKVQSVSDQKIVFTLKESGPLTIWSEKGAPKMKGASFKSIGNNLYLAELPVKSGAMEVTVTR